MRLPCYAVVAEAQQGRVWNDRVVLAVMMTSLVNRQKHPSFSLWGCQQDNWACGVYSAERFSKEKKKKNSQTNQGPRDHPW